MSIVSDAGPDIAPDLALVLALSDERDGWLRRVLAAERAGYTRGLQVGRQQGYELAHREMAAAWQAAAAPIARGGPSYVALELRRWGPGGRAHFADARPGDFTGRAQ
jgi:hypothetical protein